MKIKRAVFACLGVLLACCFSTQLARGGDVDCSISGATCSFASGSITTVPSFTVANGNDKAKVTETVYHTGSLYTYVFDVMSTGSQVLDTARVWTSLFSSDYFQPGLQYGVVTDKTSLLVDDNSFHFDPANLKVFFNGPGGGLGSGKQITFYAQGGPTSPGMFEVTNTNTAGPHGILAPFAEPSVARQLGASLLIVLGILFFCRLRHRTA